jgi:thymidylate synthase (FAD)
MTEVFAPHGTLTLDGFHANDIDVVNAAKVSFAKQVAEYGDDERKILRFLMRERHGTPFEHNYFKWHIRAPIVVWWEWVRHRIASYNLESGRYVELRPDFYLPEKARVQMGRPGNYHFEDGVDDQTWLLQKALRDLAERGWWWYKLLLENDIAKEQARLVLPMTLYVEGYFSCNARSMMNFLSLRNDSHAMFEIQQYAAEMEKQWAEIMPDTAQAFIEFGRRAP